MSLVSVSKQHTFTGHRDCVYALCQGPQTHQFFSSGADGMVVLWDLNTPDQGKLIAKSLSSVYALAYIPEHEVLIIGQNFDGIYLINLADGNPAGSLKLGNAAIFDIKVYGNHCFVALGDGTVLKIHWPSLQIVDKNQKSDKSARCLALLPQTNHLAVGYSDHKVRIFDSIEMRMLYEQESHKNSVFSVHYSPEADYLVSGSRDAYLKVYAVNDQYREVNSIVAHMYAINHIEYSPEGDYFATASMDKSVKLWDARQFQLLKVIDKSRHAGHGTSVNKLLWTKNRNQLVSCSDDRTISIWNLDRSNS